MPTEDVAEYNKSGKRRIVKRKLYPGYLVVHMEINDDTWFLVRETPGIGDFTGSAGKPTPMLPHEVAADRHGDAGQGSGRIAGQDDDSVQAATACGSTKGTSRTSKAKSRRSTRPTAA